MDWGENDLTFHDLELNSEHFLLVDLRLMDQPTVGTELTPPLVGVTA